MTTYENTSKWPMKPTIELHHTFNFNVKWKYGCRGKLTPLRKLHSEAVGSAIWTGYVFKSRHQILLIPDSIGYRIRTHFVSLTRNVLIARGLLALAGCVFIIVPFVILTALTSYRIKLVVVLCFVLLLAAGMTLTCASCFELTAATGGYAAALAILMQNT
jgi:hypothetical protein